MLCSTSLLYQGDVVHELDGPNGWQRLEDQAKRWNEQGYAPSKTGSSKCRAEATESQRRKWDRNSAVLPGMDDIQPSRKPDPTLWR